MSGGLRVLVVDDEPVFRRGCERALAEAGYDVTCAGDAENALALLSTRPFSAALLDLYLSGSGGTDLLSVIHRDYPDCAVIAMSGQGTLENAVSAMRMGACDFVPKPFLPETLREAVVRALDPRRRKIDMEQPSLAAGGWEADAMRCLSAGVLLTGDDGTVVACNPPAALLMGTGIEKTVGQPLSAALPSTPLEHAVRTCIRAGAPGTVDIPPGEGRAAYLQARLSPWRTGAGLIKGAVTLLDDVTEARRIDAVKSDFVGMVVHELRAPISTVQQLIFFLKDGQTGELSAEQTELLGRVQVRLAEVLDLIKDLLNIAKMEAGTFVFRMEPVDLVPLVEGCVESFESSAQARRVQLVRDLTDGLPQVVADPENLRIAVTNLVGNAVKYNREGGQVSVALRAKGPDIVLTVSDTGIGIPEVDLPRIFDKFYRAKDETTRWITGSGLGLSLAKSIVENHRGSIEVESVRGQGSTFRVTLPGVL